MPIESLSRKKGLTMDRKPSPYVEKSKSWIIKNVLSNYFKACNLNADIYREHHSKTDVQFDKMRQLSDVLFAAKEDLYLVYKRLIDPKRNVFERAEKVTPNEVEIRFINNVGILFHKSMVVRELEYMLEYYKTENDPDYDDIKSTLDVNVDRLRMLFDKGLALIKDFLENYKMDAVVLSFLLENSRYIEAILDQSVHSLFQGLVHDDPIENLYINVADYFRDSGWEDKAKKVLLDAIELEPESRELKEMWTLYA